MGDIADSMVNGDMCQQCGFWIGNGDGYPRDCEDCAPRKKAPKVSCPICRKRVKEAGLQMHINAVHGEKKMIVPPTKRFPDGDYIRYWLEDGIVKGQLFTSKGKPRGKPFVYHGDQGGAA